MKKVKKLSLTQKRNNKALLSTRTSIIYNCYNKNSKSFSTYGAKGITVCNEWRYNLNEFRKWAYDNKYRKGKIISRIDKTKGYYPENCRILTLKQHMLTIRRQSTISLYFLFDAELI